MSKTNSDIFDEFIEDWLLLKKETIENSDYEFYLRYLKEVQITFSKLYAEAKMQETLELIEDVLRQITHETNWAKNKILEKEIPF